MTKVVYTSLPTSIDVYSKRPISEKSGLHIASDVDRHRPDIGKVLNYTLMNKQAGNTSLATSVDV